MFLSFTIGSFYFFFYYYLLILLCLLFSNIGFYPLIIEYFKLAVCSNFKKVSSTNLTSLFLYTAMI